MNLINTKLWEQVEEAIPNKSRINDVALVNTTIEVSALMVFSVRLILKEAEVYIFKLVWVNKNALIQLLIDTTHNFSGFGQNDVAQHSRY